MTTIANLLFSGTQARVELERALHFVTGPTRVFEVAGLSIPTDDVASAIVEALQVPIGTLALQGWAHQHQVHDAIERTRADPTGREVVRLMEHVIRSTQRPEVVMEVGNSRVSLLELTLGVEIKVASAELVIERGLITHAKPGASTGSAKLMAGTVVLAQRTFRPVDVGSK